MAIKTRSKGRPGSRPQRDFKGPRAKPRGERHDHGESDEEASAPGTVLSAAQSTAKRQFVIEAFGKLWTELFLTQKHLDSALSQQNRSLKSILAQITPVVLMRPVSMAQALGVGVSSAEPWKLKPQELAHWRPAMQIAERLYGLMSGRFLQPKAMPEDFPPIMTSTWKSQFGEGVMRELVETLSSEAPLSLRVSRLSDPQSLLQGLKKEANLPVSIQLSAMTPFGLRLASYAPILNTSFYEKGEFEIQDEGSQFMALFALWPDLYAKLLTNAPGKVKETKIAQPSKIPAWTIVDACAGAGGKSLAIADALKGKGRVYSYDTSKGKLEALRRRAKRAGVNNIQTVVLSEKEEEKIISQFRKRADVVLVDAPCSGWGVLRRNPDIKWRQTPDVLERMPEIQARLLSLYSELTKVGGRLVYGVCTFRKQETEELVSQFLRTHSGFEKGPGGYLGPGPCDGFFMQSFDRKS